MLLDQDFCASFAKITLIFVRICMYSHPLVVEKLTKNFESSKFFWIGKQSFTAVDAISFHLKEGEILGLLGPNGAGKTTTIQMLLNTLTPTAGSISYFGKMLSNNNKQVLRRVAYASSYMRLPSALTVRQSLIMFGTLYDIPYTMLLQKMDEQFLVSFNLIHIIDRSVSSLSAGQTTAVLLARTFLVNSSIVLLDEPTIQKALIVFVILFVSKIGSMVFRCCLLLTTWPKLLICVIVFWSLKMVK